MKKKLNENFNLSKGTFTGKNNQTFYVIYIDPKTSENTFAFKDVIKDLMNTYGGKYFPSLKVWGWFYNPNDSAALNNLVQMKIKPLIKELETTSAKRKGNMDSQEERAIAVIDNLIKQLETNHIEQLEAAGAKPIMTETEIKSQLEALKLKLVNTTSSEDFKKLFEPIIKFKKAQGYKISIGNAILCYLQDPQATLVKSKSNWELLNREVKPGARAICLFLPTGVSYKTKEEKDQIKQKFLADRGKKSEDELTIREKETLRVELKAIENPTGFKLQPSFYDYRFTTQMQGKEDIVGNPYAADSIPWFSDGEETDESIRLVDAALEFIKKQGITVSGVANLDGARGVSKSGKIDYLKDAKKNIGMFSTLVHELSHELLHQTYLKTNNDKMKDYFIGTKDGRARVEQQAELSAWLVCNLFGYDLQEAMNYVGLWGLDDKLAITVFDSVVKVANFIYGGISEQLNGEFLNENKKFKMPANGRELAHLIGMGDVYEKAVKRVNENLKIKNLVEGKSKFKMPTTGRELANMLGLGDVYEKSLELNNMENKKVPTLEETKDEFFSILNKINNPLKKN